jgi:hypothetical protein
MGATPRISALERQAVENATRSRQTLWLEERRRGHLGW